MKLEQKNHVLFTSFILVLNPFHVAPLHARISWTMIILTHSYKIYSEYFLNRMCHNYISSNILKCIDVCNVRPVRMLNSQHLTILTSIQREIDNKFALIWFEVRNDTDLNEEKLIEWMCAQT